MNPLSDDNHDWNHDALCRFAATATLHGDDICIVAVPQTPDPTLRVNMIAAMTASKLGIRSVDYARRRYLAGDVGDKEEDELAPILAAALQHVTAWRQQLTGSVSRTDCFGAVSAKACLVRLSTSFLASSLLFRFGMLIEARSIGRVIAEQLAWAFSVRRLDADGIAKVDPRKSIGTLKHLIPHAARTYGVLSKVLHLMPPMDRYYVDVREEDDGDVLEVRTRESRKLCASSAVILLVLADMYAIVSDVMLTDSARPPETISRSPEGDVRVRGDRPFRRVVDHFSGKYWGREIPEC